MAYNCKCLLAILTLEQIRLNLYMIDWGAGECGVNWHTTTVQVDVVAYVRCGSSVAEVLTTVLQPALRTQLQVSTIQYCYKGYRHASKPRAPDALLQILATHPWEF